MGLIIDFDFLTDFEFLRRVSISASRRIRAMRFAFTTPHSYLHQLPSHFIDDELP
jgi:hypothetical protein